MGRPSDYLQEYFRYPRSKNLKIIITVVGSCLKLSRANRTDDYANYKLSLWKARSSVLAKWGHTALSVFLEKKKSYKHAVDSGQQSMCKSLIG